MKRKITALLLIVTLIISGLVGCSDKGKDKETNQKKIQNGEQSNTNNSDKTEGKKSDIDKKVGKYVEMDIELPKLEEGGKVLSIIQNQENQIEVYSVTTKDSKRQYQCYRLKDDFTWENKECGWLNRDPLDKVPNDKAGNEIYDICVGKDGNYYACYVGSDGTTFKSTILKSEDGGKTANTLDIPYLEEIVKEEGGSKLCAYVSNIDVLQDGSLVIYDILNTDNLLVFSSSGEKISEIPISNKINISYKTTSFLVTGNKIIVMPSDNKGFSYYNPELMETEKNINYDLKDGNLTYTVKEDRTLLVVDKDGIHRLSEDGTLWETTVEGTANSMSLPSYHICSLYVTGDEQEKYFVTYQDEDMNYYLKSYQFDTSKDATTPAEDKEITIYSLKPNDTIKQAVSLYQIHNKDIKINYVTGMKPEEGRNVSDFIREINTEILAGKGPDILILDGLPIDSYLEKGILADISDIINPMIEDGSIPENIAKNYQVDGKIYQMPIKYSVPVIVGKKDAIQSIDSMDNINNYIDNSNDDLPYADRSAYRELIHNYMTVYLNELFKDGKLSEDTLSKFLTSIKKIADDAGATEKRVDGWDESSVSDCIVDNQNVLNGLFIDLYNKKCSTSNIQVKTMDDTIWLYTILDEHKDYDYSTVNQMFVPYGIVGLNTASKNSEAAKNFIKYLYSDEVQKSQFGDGFPMNNNTLQGCINKEVTGTYSIGTGTGDTMTGEYPAKEKREDFLETIKTVTNPIKIDQILYSIIIDEGTPYLKGEKDLDEVVSTIVNKVNTYLAE